MTQNILCFTSLKKDVDCGNSVKATPPTILSDVRRFQYYVEWYFKRVYQSYKPNERKSVDMGKENITLTSECIFSILKITDSEFEYLCKKNGIAVRSVRKHHGMIGDLPLDEHQMVLTFNNIDRLLKVLYTTAYVPNDI